MGARSYLESCQRLQWASKVSCTVRNSVGHTHGALWVPLHLSVPPPVPAPQQLLWSCDSSPITCTCRRNASRLTVRVHWTLHLPLTLLGRSFGHKLTQTEYQRESEKAIRGQDVPMSNSSPGAASSDWHLCLDPLEGPATSEQRVGMADSPSTDWVGRRLGPLKGAPKLIGQMSNRRFIGPQHKLPIWGWGK